MRLVYVVASYLLFAVLAPFLWLHKKTRGGFLARFGVYPPLPDKRGPRVWLHGASAGDLLSISPMLPQLRARLPGCSIVCTTTTNTGYLMATGRLKGEFDAVMYSPWDLWGATRRAVRTIRPDLLVLEYAEIWPNLIHAAHASGARIAITNGRFAAEHLAKYRWLFRLIGNPLRAIALFLMREPDEAERAIALGAPAERVKVTGNTKFDALAALGAAKDGPLKETLNFEPGTKIWIAGSTHEGEEEILVGVYNRLRAAHPELRLVIAPRYIDRAARVVAIAESAGLTVRRRTEPFRPAQVVVLDTIGELAQAYRLATLVFVGGSFTSRGGQNILEPAAQGKPVLFGPSMENFHDSVQVLVGRGGIQVPDPEALERVLSELLARPEAIASLGELARAAVRQVSGASARNVEQMAALLGVATARAVG
jgi:3-deoxy-D-manno-octulosonic-acid transferase